MYIVHRATFIFHGELDTYKSKYIPDTPEVSAFTNIRILLRITKYQHYFTPVSDIWYLISDIREKGKEVHSQLTSCESPFQNIIIHMMTVKKPLCAGSLFLVPGVESLDFGCCAKTTFESIVKLNSEHGTRNTGL